MNKTIRVGFVHIATNPYFDLEFSERVARESLRALTSIPDTEVFEAPAITLSGSVGVDDVLVKLPAVTRRTAGALRALDLDILVIQSGCFNLDGPALAVSQAVSVPVVIWATPETFTPGGGLRLNSLAGALSNACALGKAGREAALVLGFPSDKAALRNLSRLINQIRALKALRTGNLGLIGANLGYTSYLVSSYSEPLLREVLGTTLIHIELAEFLSAYEQVTQAGARDALHSITIGQRSSADDDDLLKSARLYLALKQIKARHNLDFASIRCLPELKDAMELNPCLPMAKLADEGFLVGCETDVNNLVTMIMEWILAGTPPFFGDVIALDEQANTALFFHCGAAAPSLADNPDAPKLEKHLMGGTTTLEFPLKPGRVTVARLTEDEGGYAMFIAGGEVRPYHRPVRGNYANVRFDADMNDILSTILSRHIEHHMALCYGDVVEDLAGACECAGIEPIGL